VYGLRLSDLNKETTLLYFVDVRFICKDTIEEKIVALQKRKSALAANVLTGYDLTLPAHSLLFVHLPEQLANWGPIFKKS